MGVYVDPLMNWGWKLGSSCHMVADTEEELHRLAARIGLKRSWYQDLPKHNPPHYDLTASKRAQAIRAGATPVGFSDFVAVTYRMRQTWPKLRALASNPAATPTP